MTCGEGGGGFPGTQGTPPAYGPDLVSRDGFCPTPVLLWMTTRSGKSYKQPRMEEMQGMLKLLVEDRRRREEVAAERLKREAEFETERTRMEAERQRRERESGKQMAELRGHLKSLMKVVADSHRKPEGVSHKQELSVRLVPLTEKDDIEAYLVTFVRIMAAHQVEKDCWPQYLAPQLTGRAQLAFAARLTTTHLSWPFCSVTILQRRRTEDAFVTLRGSGETNRGLAVRLMDLLGKWLKKCNSVEEVREYI